RRRVPVGPGGAAGRPASGGWSAPASALEPGPGSPTGNGNGNVRGQARQAPGSTGNGSHVIAPRPGLGRRPEIPYVSPLRGGRIPDAGPLELAGAASPAATMARPATADPTELPPIDPPEPVLTHASGDADLAAPDHDLEPALPEEARSRAAADSLSATIPLDATGSGRTLHVRFNRAPSLQLVPAMEALRQVLKDRPGETTVVVHVPGPAGASLPMPLRTPVAYDAELIAEIQRRLGAGIVDLSLA
ncbi:MAG TPA: hypothetical protein VET90_00825, partial [Candidatus Binatus sp.]|nr:hypothetical protein [Candidatus Binatus sp.]